jgi:hypothetical protein
MENDQDGPAAKDDSPPTKAERLLPLLFTGAIALFALCSVIVGLLQWNAMNKQWEVMHGQLEQMKESRAPYVVADTMTPHDFPDGKELPSFNVHFHNFGHGVATNVKGNVTLELGLGPHAPPTTMFEPSGNFTFSPMPEGANSLENTSADKAIRRSLDAIKVGDTPFYVVGFISFSDTDGKQFPQQDFCFAYDPSRKSFVLCAIQ